MSRAKGILENVKPYRADRAITASGAIRHFLDPLNNPRFESVARARHMRDDDYVVGLEYRGQTRAYPCWIIDYYHVVNDRFDNQPAAVFS